MFAAFAGFASGDWLPGADWAFGLHRGAANERDRRPQSTRRLRAECRLATDQSSLLSRSGGECACLADCLVFYARLARRLCLPDRSRPRTVHYRRVRVRSLLLLPRPPSMRFRLLAHARSSHCGTNSPGAAPGRNAAPIRDASPYQAQPKVGHLDADRRSGWRSGDDMALMFGAVRPDARTKKGGPCGPPSLVCSDGLRSEVHVAHATHTAATRRHRRCLLLRLLRDHRLGGHQ